jgi:hypothetical protein
MLAEESVSVPAGQPADERVWVSLVKEEEADKG